MVYQLRFFFDLGSGVCLWSKNDAANEKFGYPVDHWKLLLTENTKRWLDHLIVWFDVSLDWDNAPAESSVWTAEESERFKSAVAIGLEYLVNELLQDEFVIKNEFNT